MACCSLARCNAGRMARRCRMRVLTSVLAVAGVGPFCLHVGRAPAPGFTGTASPLSAGCAPAAAQRWNRVGVRRHASGFNYGKAKGSGKGFGGDAKANQPPVRQPAGDTGDNEELPSQPSTGLVKDTSEGKSKALSTSKLKDLRDKTLALRQKREAELDEYEEGRALIAKYGPKVAVMPEKVAQRAAKRGMVIGGSFYGVMLGVFAVGIFLFKTQELIIPPTLMAFVTLALLALAIGGSSYGMMSASWDEDREGSLLGTEEFGKNVKAIGEGFRRMSMQDEYEKAIELRSERRRLLQAKEEKKRELLNK
mmetsp:Transcript_82389/g.228590  ORF Transcript_82389/g.228590 Transcript_82389/m.228590 type:complete len:309 (-) Transcript_82389:144-1070(-)